MTDPLDQFRRDAKVLQTSYETGARAAYERVHPLISAAKTLKHADFLHVLAREQNHASWPAMKEAVSRLGLDRAGRQQRLKLALQNGQVKLVKSLCADDSAIAEGAFALQCALYDRDAVAQWLAKDPSVVRQTFGLRGRPIHHLAFSRGLQIWPERKAAMLEIAQMLLDAGAEVNDAYAPPGQQDHMQTPLYGAVAFAGNMALAQWLLDHGANPSDAEALYHACELGHAEGVRLLVQAGANPKGTNALKRAMDFDNIEMVDLLLATGADPNEEQDGWTALHHAALRMASSAVCRSLLAAGADQAKLGKGVTAFAAARIHGNQALADMLDPTPLTPEEELLAQAATGVVPDGAYVDPNRIPKLYLNLVREFAGAPEKLRHIKALIKIGMPWDQGDAAGVTPVQIAGWLGQAEMVAYFLQLKPDLSHVNGYGGTLLSTILHGAAHNPTRAKGDYLACLETVLKEGVALPENTILAPAEPEITVFLEAWAKRHPGQVIKNDNR